MQWPRLYGLRIAWKVLGESRGPFACFLNAMKAWLASLIREVLQGLQTPIECLCFALVRGCWLHWLAEGLQINLQLPCGPCSASLFWVCKRAFCAKGRFALISRPR